MKDERLRRILILSFTCVIIAGIILLNCFSAEKFPPDMYSYYIRNGYDDTSVINLVGAIYMNYRVFDTLFEAMLLAAAVTAVIYFSSPWDKNKEGE
jgi:multisubunit Na+/H+ antiporter MnhB subunit